MSATQAFEQLAERGTPRGADAVLRAARSGSSAEVPTGRRWPVRAVLVGVAAVFVLIVALALRGGNEDSQPVDTGPGPGYLFGEPTETTLIINTGFGSLVALDLDTGLAQQYPDVGAKPTDTFLQPMHRVDGSIVYPGADGPTALSVDMTGAPSLVAPSRGDFWVSGDANGVWVLEPDLTVSLHRLDGSVIRGPYEVPRSPDGQILTLWAGVGSGFAASGPLEGRPTAQFWDPATGTQVAVDGQDTVAATGSTLVTGWLGSIATVPGGENADITPDLYGTHAAVSPDERRVAAWAADTVEGGEAAAPGLVIIDAVSGAWQRVSGADGAEVSGLTWSEDGRWVFGVGPGHVVAYRIGEPRAMDARTASITGGGPVAVASDNGPDFEVAQPPTCPEPSAASPSPRDSVVQNGVLTDEVEVPITSDQPCVILHRGL